MVSVVEASMSRVKLKTHVTTKGCAIPRQEFAPNPQNPTTLLAMTKMNVPMVIDVYLASV